MATFRYKSMSTTPQLNLNVKVLVGIRSVIRNLDMLSFSSAPLAAPAGDP
jgi:hypothetical protein